MKSKISFRKIYSKLDDESKQLVDAELSVCELEEKDMPLIRHSLESKSLESDENTSAGYISTIDVDRSGEVCIPSGFILKDFLRNPVIYKNHDKEQDPIAKCIDIRIDEKGVWAKWAYNDTPEAQSIKRQVKNGFYNTLSIGFLPLAYKVKGQKGFNELGYPNANRVITKLILLEFSIVGIPCNPGAEITEKGIDATIEIETKDSELKIEETNEIPAEPTVEESEIKEEKEVKEIKKLEFKKVQLRKEPTQEEIENMIAKRLEEALLTRKGLLIFE
jgi:HK97 family phage prohead protease